MQARVKVVDNRRAVKRKADAGAFESLNHAAASVRKTAQFSIKKNKSTSEPGKAPHSPSGHLRRVIRYKASKPKDTEQLAEIGATNEYAKTIWHLHEHGGRGQKPKIKKLKPLNVGDFGPVRSMGYKFAYVRLRTAKQVARAENLQAAENRRRAEEPAPVYPARPFMRPALEKMRSRLPSFWRGSVK